MMQRIYKQNLLQGLLESAMDAFVVTDHENTVLEWNENAVKLFGYTQEEALGKKLNDLIVPPEYAKFHTDSKTKTAKEYNDRNAHPILNRRLEVPAKHKDGSKFPIELTVIPVEIDDKLYFSASIRDLSQRKRDMDELKRRADLINLSRDGIYVVNENHELILWNKGAEAMYGYSEEEVLGKVSYSMLKTKFPIDKSTSIQDGFAEIIRHLVSKGAWEGELVQCTKDGERVVVLSRWAFDENRREVLVTNTNITELKKNRERAEYLANYDELTGLPNRRLLDDRITQAINQAQRNKTLVGILLLDLDRFKIINDSLGHDQGDILLKEVAARLKSVVRAEDTVARLGGDEFAIVLENCEHVECIAEVAEKILKAVSKPVKLSENGQLRDVTIHTSIGASVYPNDGENVTPLLRNADLAMYRSKEMEAGAFRFYSHGMNEMVLQRLMNESNLRHALEAGEFLLHFQPKICSAENRTTGVEALIRWKHPVKGMIYPGDFIQLAEEIGIIDQIGEWVLFAACRQNKEWQDKGLPPIKMSVNLSVHQISPAMVDTVKMALQSSGLDPKWLDLEVTESAAMRDIEMTQNTLNQLRDLGVSISIDDFGTGFSSLSHLKKMPLDYLKIDQSFVRGIDTQNDDQCIVSAIISMAHNLKLRVIAEGVTNKEQVAFLDTHKCDEMQGYLFSRPMSAAEVEETIIRQVWKWPYHMERPYTNLKN